MNYDFSQWHKACTNKVVNGDNIVCLDCGISANIEAISAKISPADACKVGVAERISLGKQSPNVDRGLTK